MMSRTPVLDLSVDPGTGLRSNLDWPNGVFEAEVREIYGRFDVIMTMERVAGVEQLLRRGDAAWAVEARCSETGWARTFTAESNTDRAVNLTISRDDTTDLVDLWPGVVSRRDSVIEMDEQTKADLHPVLVPKEASGHESSRIRVTAHRWLVRGRPIQMRTGKGKSLVEFRADDSLGEGQVKIQPDGDGTDHWYSVSVHPDHKERSHRDPMLGWSAYGAALAMLPNNEKYEIERNDLDQPVVRGSVIGQKLATQLHNADVKLWDDEVNWDPLWALCHLPDMRLPRRPDDEDED